MALPAKKIQYTLADCLAWSEDDRAEIIDGEVYLMAPPSRRHQSTSGELYRQLANYLEGKDCKVYAAPFGVRLFERKGDAPYLVDTVVEPDIVVVCDPDKLDDIGCRGAPDLIMEILSPSSLRHDRLTKFNLYRRAGVREYWIVDPASQTVQSFVLEGNHYVAKDFGAPGDQLRVNVLEDCTIDLTPVFAE